MRSARSGRSLRVGRASLSRPSERRLFSREPSRGARLSPVTASLRSPRRPPRRPSRRSLSRGSLSRRDSGVLTSFLAGTTGACGVALEPKRFFNQAKKPPPVGGAAGAVAATAGVWTALGAGLAISGLACATGAGASGSTPLITGVCLLVGSCERRVTVVASSISSAIL